MFTFYLTAVTVVRVPRMSCCCWSGVWTLNYTVWLKFCHFPNCKTVTRNWILFVTRLTRLLGGFIELGLHRTWIHSNFLNIWTIANPVTVVRNHLQSAVRTVHPAVCRCDNYKSRVTRDTWHWSPWPEHSWHHHRDPDPAVDVPSERIEETMNCGSLGSLMKFTWTIYLIFYLHFYVQVVHFTTVAVLYLMLLLHWPALERWRVLRR